MTDATIHYRGVNSEQRRLPAVPVVGSYILDQAPAGRLWEVAAVVYGNQAVEVYAVEVSPRLAGELTAAWAAWSEPAEQPGPT